MHRTIPIAGLILLLAACSGTDGAGTTTAAVPATASPPTTAAASTTISAGPATSPAVVVFEPQESDGSQVVVASVTLPSPGFVAVHGNADGAPGPVVGHSGLLPAGTSTDVAVTLDTALTSTDLLFPMAHIDMDENGVYEFEPPDNVVDGPATTAEGEVAVTGAEVTVDPATAAAPTVAVSATDLGEILVDGEGRTLYLFLPDEQGDSTCYDDCAGNWPPLIGTAAPGEGADPALIGTVPRSDGSDQVTYGGWPLYYFAADTAAGDVNGQGVGDVWFVVSPGGEPVR